MGPRATVRLNLPPLVKQAIGVALDAHFKTELRDTRPAPALTLNYSSHALSLRALPLNSLSSSFSSASAVAAGDAVAAILPGSLLSSGQGGPFPSLAPTIVSTPDDSDLLSPVVPGSLPLTVSAFRDPLAGISAAALLNAALPASGHSPAAAAAATSTGLPNLSSHASSLAILPKQHSRDPMLSRQSSRDPTLSRKPSNSQYVDRRMI